MVSPAWQTTEFSLGENDVLNTCGPTALANLVDVWCTEAGKPQIVMDGEVERFYSLVSGYGPEHPERDVGTVLEDLIQRWCRDGWPSDPVCKPPGYRSISTEEISEAIARSGAVPCWAQLPAIDDDDHLFGDDVLSAEPGDGHAMLCVEATTGYMMLITWAESVQVSTAWWAKFGRGQFEVYRVPS